MKLSSLLLYLLFLFPSLTTVLCQDSQPECGNWTQTEVYDKNPAMQPAHDAYIAAIKAKIEESCFDSSTGAAIPCSIEDASSIPEGDAYRTECHNGGGAIWTYTYGPACDTIADTSQATIKPVLVCVSPNCVEVGATNLAPQPELKELGGFNCSFGIPDIEKEDVDDTTTPAPAPTTTTDDPEPQDAPASGATANLGAAVLGSSFLLGASVWIMMIA